MVWQFQRTCRKKKFTILAYCLMPDHVHLLIEGSSETSDFRHLMKSAKQSSSQRFAASFKRPLWQEGFYDRVLREDDDPKNVARYVIENPVRAGLVCSALDYPLSGSDIWTLEELMNSLW